MKFIVDPGDLVYGKIFFYVNYDLAFITDLVNEKVYVTEDKDYTAENNEAYCQNGYRCDGKDPVFEDVFKRCFYEKE